MMHLLFHEWMAQLKYGNISKTVFNKRLIRNEERNIRLIEATADGLL